MAKFGWKQFVPVYFFTSVSLILVTTAFLLTEISLMKALILTVAGFISWSFVEYVLHRFIFHYEAKAKWAKKLIYRMHLEHHDYPKEIDQLFSGLGTSIPIASLYYLLVLFFVGYNGAAFMFTGLIIGYFLYEFLHYSAHHRAPKMRFLQYLKRYHMLHHHLEANMRYGVTSPVIDYLFGTFGPAVRKRDALMMAPKLASKVAVKVAAKVANKLELGSEMASEIAAELTKELKSELEKSGVAAKTLTNS
ncbi:MAG: sterol desaturase family protein [Blastocatellia bacterium]|nr:sterol desaturase family protein [Blastocatellia bacterium]